VPLFSHCPTCGGPTIPQFEGESIQHYDCSRCGFRFYSNPAPTATAIIENAAGEILLTKRVIEPYYGCWDLPGGYIKNGEAPLAALAREIREELRLQVDVLGLIDIFPDVYADPHSHTFNLFYRARYLGGDIRPGDDVGDYCWVQPSQLPAEMAFNCVRQAISAYLNLKLSSHV